MIKKIVNILLSTAIILNAVYSISAFAAGVEYDDRYYKEVLNDDFSGDLSKWNVGAGYTLQDNDTVQLYSHAQYFEPVIDAAQNIIFEFDAIGWQGAMHIDFKNADSSKSGFALTIPNRDLDAGGNIGIVSGDTVMWALGDLYGGTADEPKTNSIRVVLENGTLRLYAKASTAEDYALLSEFDNAYVHPNGVAVSNIIDAESAYIPRIRQLYSGESFTAAPTYIDNVSIKTIPTVYGTPEVENTSFREDFSESNWADDWDNVQPYFWENDIYNDRSPYQWDESGKVYLHQWGYAIYAKDITGHELTAELTVETKTAVDKPLYVWFENVNNSADNVQIAINSNQAFFVSDGTTPGAIGGIGLTEDDAEFETYIFDLDSDKLTITEKTSGDTAVLSGDTFKTHFTEGAEYKVGIYTVYMYSTDSPVWIDSFNVDAVKYVDVQNKTLQVGAQTFDEGFTNENWADNWDGIAPGYWANGQYYESAPYTWDQENDKTFFYMWNVPVYPKNISGKEITAELTLETANASDKMIWIKFQNINDATDYVSARITSGAVVLGADTDEAQWAVGGISLTTDEAPVETYTFALEADKLTVYEKTTGASVVFDGDNFNSYFTDGAEYKVGFQTLYFFSTDENPVWIDSFKVTTPPTDALDIDIKAEMSDGVYENISKIEPGVNYKLKLSESDVDGTYFVVVYDGERYIDLHTIDAFNTEIEFLVPYSAVSPKVRVFAWKDLDNLIPIGDAVGYATK